MKLNTKFRPSFTLVELLVSIAIIGVMAGMVLFSLAGARQDANISKTRHTIEKLNSIILQEWEEFRYRAAKIEIDSEMLRPQRSPANPNLIGQPPIAPREGARLRMIVLRDLMRMEMPDRLSDVWYPPTAYKAAAFTANNPGDTSDDLPYYAGPMPGLVPGSRIVPGKYNNFRTKIGLGSISSPYTGAVAPAGALPPGLNTINQGAEWLYQIVASASFQGGNALESFRPTEIGDADGDGMLEFLDAWGTPIRWLRWPSGFPSALNSGANPDAMDPVRTDWRWTNSTFTQKPWLLVPLIISAGPDEVFDVSFDMATPVEYAVHTWAGTNSPAHSAGGAYYFPDPYVGFYTGNGLGSLFDEDGDGTFNGASDNIHSHALLLE